MSIHTKGHVPRLVVTTLFPTTFSCLYVFLSHVPVSLIGPVKYWNLVPVNVLCILLSVPLQSALFLTVTRIFLGLFTSPFLTYLTFSHKPIVAGWKSLGLSSTTLEKGPMGRQRGDLRRLGHLHGYCCGKHLLLWAIWYDVSVLGRSGEAI